MRLSHSYGTKHYVIILGSLFVCGCSHEIEFGSIVSPCECLLLALQYCIEDKAMKLTRQSPGHLKNTQLNEAERS